MNNLRVTILFTACVLCLLPADLYGQNRFFDSASSGTTWDNQTTANWGTVSGVYNTTVFGSYNDGRFEGTGATITVNGSVNVNDVSFTTDGYIIQDGNLNKGSPSGGPVFSVSGANTATINSSISSTSNGFQKQGTGTLVLAGDVDWQGTADTNSNRWVRLEAGTLQIADGMSANDSFLVLGNNGSDANPQTFAQTGGEMTQAVNIFAGNNANSGLSVLDFSGGTFTQTGGETILATREDTTMNVSGTADVTLERIRANLINDGTTATVNLSGGSLTVPSLSNVRPNSTFEFNFDGGTLKTSASTEAFMQGLTVANVNSGGAVIDTNGFDITIAQDLLNGDGDGGLTKLGGGTLTLTGANTYTGDTDLQAGTLSINNAYLDDFADVYMTTGATFDLNFSSMDTIDELFFDGVPQAIGTWGSLDSAAENKSEFFTGSGVLNVTAAVPEPSTLVFAVLGLLGGFASGRRR